ncbi:MAG TPA: glycoside hydrolase family 16 protein [Phycisphaerae bacterium]|nr:glycoside hydrolase family 16 protein [Phycisphaerae bacterium]
MALRFLRHAALSVLFVLAGGPSAVPAYAATPSSLPADDYRLVWSDEFNTEGPLNPENWNYERGFVRNEELQWYQPENATCHNGFLVIEARREHKLNPHYVAGSASWRTSREFIEYTSASVTTARKHSFQYGRFEIRARINTRQGSWPAFWTLGNRGPWPANGEIDIMEYYDNTLLANIAWLGAGGSGDGRSFWNSVRTPLAKLGPDWSNQFHTWRMDWSESAVKLYCDDKLLNSQDLAKTINDPELLRRAGPGSPEGTAAPSNPFRQPEYILLNQAIGGHRGGDPTHTPFPIRYEIDYVRVYQTPAQIAAQLSATQPSPAAPTTP